MEPGETLRSNLNDHSKSNTRRISSILKAARTPLKALGAENEDCQEDQTQKTDKKRKYRRVSFATTNDVKYISSPGRTQDPDITETDCQKDRDCDTENVRQQIIGMETLLNAPLHVSQHNKENVFYPGVQHNNADETVVFSGEDSAYMDMTHCHTVIIDANVDEINETSSYGVIDFLSKLETASNEKSRKSDSIPFTGPAASKVQLQESEIENLLPSWSEANHGTSTGGKKSASTTCTVNYREESSSGATSLSKQAAQSAVLDKENQASITQKPVCDVMSLRPFPSKNNTLPVIDHTMVFPSGDNVDMTESHTVFIDVREVLQQKSGRNMQLTQIQTMEADVSQLTTGEQFSIFNRDDMEMTKSQTVVIDTNMTRRMFNPSLHSSKTTAPSSEMVPFSDDDREITTGNMMLTGEIKHCPTGEDDANCSSGQHRDSFPCIKVDCRALFSRLAQSSVTGNEKEIPDGTEKFEYDANKQTALVGNKILAVVPADPDDMEMTRSQTVVIGINNPAHSTTNGSYLFVPEKTVMFSEEDYGMEMATDLILPIEENNHVLTGDKTVEKMVPLMKSFSYSDVLDEMELTATRVATAGCNLTTPSDSEDMEMTEIHTPTDSKKHCVGITNPLLRSGNKSHSYMPANKTNVPSDPDSGEAITAALTMPVKRYDQSLNVEDCMEEAKTDLLYTLQYARIADEAAPVDGVNSITPLSSDLKKAHGPEPGIESPNLQTDYPAFSNETSRLEGRQISSPPKTIIFSEDDYDMEMTTAATVLIEKHSNADEATARFSTAETVLCLDQPHKGSTSTAGCQGLSSNIWTAHNERETSNSSLNLYVPQSALPVGDRQTVDIIESSSAPVVQCNEKNVFTIDCAGAMSKGQGSSVNKEDSLSIAPRVSSQKEDKSVKTTNKKSRRVSLADIKSQLEHIKDMINEPEDIANRCFTAPLPQLGSDSEAKETVFKSTNCSPNKDDDNTQSTSKEHNTDLWEGSVVHKQCTNMTAPVNFEERKPCITRMSFGGFLPKLPQKTKVFDQNRSQISNSGSLLKKTVATVTSYQSSSSAFENIEDELLPEISSEEDLTETLESKVQTHACVRENLSNGTSNLPAADEPVFVESTQNVMQGQKRALPVDGHEDAMSGERKMRKSPDSKCNSTVVEMVGENLPSVMTKTLDTVNTSNSTTFMGTNGTFETSAQRCSQYDTDFDEATEYEHDLRKKLDDGSITVQEFLKIFGIDFVIHRPRHSVLPDNFAIADNAEDLLVEKYINRPKQRIYEDDSQELSKMVEKLKSRMWDQDKPLKTINYSFWEVVKTYTEEQFNSLGSKLKERKVYFRKKSKALSHEMKMGLYANLVQATQLAEQNLKEKITDVDDLLKNLDEFLHDLQAELDLLDTEGLSEASVNSELLCSLEVRQQELERLNIAVAEKERMIGELELEINSKRDKISNIKEETQELKKYKAVLDRMVEWKLCEKTSDRAVFNLLYGSVQLEVVFESHTDKTQHTEMLVKKVGNIKFHLQLDERNSQDYACLVHNLIGQFIETKSNWVKKYPAESDIPLLLHDVALVVSRCRTLGEEIHRLKKWGSLKLDIMEIACKDKQIKILFSSLKVFAKFEVTLVVSPEYPMSSLQVLHLKNYIGDIRMCQIEDVVTSVTPSKNYLIKVVKKIHEALLV
ncbi:uncharacterized protein knl1 [Scleropages formosus]|nr:kinetochore scaffold 1 [Scleropages formosus]